MEKMYDLYGLSNQHGLFTHNYQKANCTKRRVKTQTQDIRTRPQPLLSRLLFAILVLGRLCCFGRLKVRGEEKVRFWDCRSIKMWERNVDISPEAQLTI